MVDTSSENVAWFVKNIGDTEVASLIEALAAERDAALSNSPVWRSMDSAPKDGYFGVDLWCQLPDGYGEGKSVRLTDCYWTGEGWARLLDDGNEDLIEKEATCSLGLPPWKPVAWMVVSGPSEPEVISENAAWNAALDAAANAISDYQAFTRYAKEPLTQEMCDEILALKRPISEPDPVCPAPVWREPVFIVKVKRPDEPHMIDAETRTIIGREEFDRCNEIFRKEGWTVLDVQERATTTVSDLAPGSQPTEQPPQADVQGAAGHVLANGLNDETNQKIATAMALVLRADIDPSAWNTDCELLNAFSAALRALAGEE